MAKKNTATSSAPVVAAPKRGRGRPSAFPGQETTVMGTRIPVETQAALRSMVGEDETINAAINRIILDAHAAAEKRAAAAAKRRKAKKAAAPVTEASN